MVRNANAEAAFEKRPRKQAEVAQHRELLPTKQADGSLKRQRVKLSKKEIAKQRRAESGSEKGKKKKSEKKAEKQASAAASKKRPTSEAALQKMASQLETSAMTLDEKKAAVARLSQRLLQAPHKNVKLLRQLHDLATRDPSAVVQRLALLSEVAVLRDVLPAYRIRLPTEKELQMQVSTDVAELREYEKVLLRSYEDCLASLGKWLRGSAPQRVAAVRGLCALVTKGRDFNAIHKIIEMLVPVCNWKEDALREAACGAMAELFVEDGQGDATLLAVRGMAELFKNSSFNVHPAMLEAWLELKLDAAPNSDEGVNSNTPSSKKAKKRKRTLDPVTRELAAAAGERGNKGLVHGRILEQIFVSYARVIKKCPTSPLMPIVLRGIAKFAHQVNVSLLLDVLSNLRAMLRSDSGTRMATDVALHCVHATLRMLSGHGQALSVDQKDLQLRLFEALHEPEAISDASLLATALDCLEHLCKHRTSLLAARTASFVRRLLQMTLVAPHGHALALLCAINRLLIACPRVTTLLESDEGFGRVAPQATAHEDPDAPHALQSTAWHLSLLMRHHHPVVADVAERLASQLPLPPHLVKATPGYIMSSFSEEEGAFKPAPTPPKPRAAGPAPAGAAASQQGRKSARQNGAAVCSLEEVRGAAAAAEKAGPCKADFAAVAFPK